MGAGTSPSPPPPKKKIENIKKNILRKLSVSVFFQNYFNSLLTVSQQYHRTIQAA